MTRLSTEDRLRMVQLRLLDWISAREEQLPFGSGGPSVATTLPEEWELTRQLRLHDWQTEAVDRWFANGHRGTIKVVTGAGKTVVALAIAQRLQRDLDHSLALAIVVPTIVLMNQWRDVFRLHSNLPPTAVGLLGGGFADKFDGNHRVIITVLASARKFLADAVTRAAVGPHLLLVADECHRAGAPEMSKVLMTTRAYSLGLSATPEREGDAEGSPRASYNESPLGRAVGPIVYEMNFARAIELGVLPQLEVRHYGLALSTQEREAYERLSRDMRDARRDLRARSSGARAAGGGETFLAWCRRVAARGGDGNAALAARYIALSSSRKDLLFSAETRRTAARELLTEELGLRPDSRAILFHERIAEAQRLFELLIEDGLPAVLEHGELPDELREASLRLFRDGVARVMVSVKALIEGLNVPEADLGVVVASSTSVRQRIQSIGRVLRKHRGVGGEEKTARVCLLYIRDTVDDRLYEKMDWDALIGGERSVYYVWEPPAPPVLQQGPPRVRVPSEQEIDVAALEPGDPYLGRYDGEEFSSDSRGNVLDAAKRIASNPQSVPDAVRTALGRAGRFKVTPQRHSILVLRREGGSWQPRYLGRLAEPFQFGEDASSTAKPDVSRLEPGDPYVGPLVPAQEFFFRQRAGGRVGKKVRRGEVYAFGESAERLAAILRRLAQDLGPVSRFFVNDLNHAYWREEGRARFIAALSERLTLPDANSDDA